MKFIQNAYYKVFVSAIVTIQNSQYSGDIWRFMSIFFISVAMSSNILCLWIAIETHWSPGFTDFLKIEFFPNNKYNAFLSFVLWLYIPIHFFNWFHILRKDLYKKHLLKYPDAKGKKISGIYFIVSWFGFFAYWIFELASRQE